MKNLFSKRLAEVRCENKLTRGEFAKKINVSLRLVCYWENGERECSFDMLLKISEVLDVSIDYLLGKTEY